LKDDRKVSFTVKSQERRKRIIRYFPVYGCMSTALIYIAVGVIAILSFLKIRHGGADESSMLAIINDFVLGKIVIILILAGLLCYVIWRFYEAFSDPYRCGRTRSGIVKRVGICLSTAVDIIIISGWTDNLAKNRKWWKPFWMTPGDQPSFLFLALS
jgi:hypothetical protein